MASLNEILERKVSSSEAGRINSRTRTAGWKKAKSSLRILVEIHAFGQYEELPNISQGFRKRYLPNRRIFEGLDNVADGSGCIDNKAIVSQKAAKLSIFR